MNPKKLIEDILCNTAIIDIENNKGMVNRKYTKAESKKIQTINLSLSVIRESVKILDQLISTDGTFHY